HDMGGVRSKHVIRDGYRPVRIHDVEPHRLVQVGERGLAHPLGDSRQVLFAIAWNPHQVRQVSGAMDSVLSGAGSDLEYRAALEEPLTQYREDRLAVALTGLGEWLHGRRRKCWR